MKKLSLLLVLAFAFTLGTQAQKIGVKAGYGLSGYNVNFYTPDGSGMSTGLNAGLVAAMDLKVIELRADVTFIQLGSNYDSRNETDENWPTDLIGYEYDYKQNINYLNIGVSAVKSFGPAYLTVGPYFGYGLKANQTTTISPLQGDEMSWTVDLFSDPTEMDFTQPFSDDNNQGGAGDYYNQTDVGLNLGIGASFGGIFAEANVAYGLLNFINTDSQYYDQDDFASRDDQTQLLGTDAKQNNLFFGISIGYMFGF